MNHCTSCSWTGTNDELRLKNYPNGGDDTVCPKCGGRVEKMDDIKLNDMEKFNNGLTDAELERIALLAEECAEVQQICMKIIRHGYGSHNPFDEKKTPNRELLNKELGDLDCIITMMSECGDINRFAVKLFRVKKQESLQQYLHHNTIKQINWDQTP